MRTPRTATESIAYAWQLEKSHMVENPAAAKNKVST